MIRKLYVVSCDSITCSHKAESESPDFVAEHGYTWSTRKGGAITHHCARCSEQLIKGGFGEMSKTERGRLVMFVAC